METKYECCINCKKYCTNRCEVYKADGKRPNVGDWCKGYKIKLDKQ